MHTDTSFIHNTPNNLNEMNENLSNPSSNTNQLPGDSHPNTQALANKALTLYSLPINTKAHIINISENVTYRVESPCGKKWALRLHRQGYHSTNAIASELAWINALRNSRAAITPTPIAGTNGSFIQQISHESSSQPRHAVLFAWEDGVEADESQEDLSHAFESLGKVTARMHIHARNWERPASFERLTWDFETTLGSRPHWGSWRDGLAMTPKIEALFARTSNLIHQRLQTFGSSPDRFNLIHGDIRPANFFINKLPGTLPQVKVIDFDDCGFSWFMYDCATTVSFFEHKPEVPNLIASWLQGYRKVIDLPSADEDEIPTFLMLRRIILVAWVASHLNTELAQSLGTDYTESTIPLCEDYLSKFT